MLNKEPELRVGIVLPQDKYKEIDVILEKDQSYEIASDRGSLKLSAERLFFKLADDYIWLNSHKKSKVWKLTPLIKRPLTSKAGVKLRNIKAGRGFHWQKLIDVYLPGRLELTIFNNSIMVINGIFFEDYLACVATSEMAAACPSAFVECQTIAARSWMLANVERKHLKLGMDVCNDDCCQRYQGSGNLTNRVINHALQTKGLILKSNNNICDTRYAKCCGGVREGFAAIWGGQDKAYLPASPDAESNFSHPSYPFQSEEDISHWINEYPKCYCNFEGDLKKYLGHVDETASYYRWKVELSQQELTLIFANNLRQNVQAIIDLIPLSRGKSGRLVELKVNYLDEGHNNRNFIISSEYEIRRILHKNFLFSSCIYFIKDTSNTIPDHFIIKGAGWGHGVGLCQIGALNMSLHGQTTDSIINHYYPGSNVEKIY